MEITDQRVKDTLEKLEDDTWYAQGLKSISGGFASADIFDYDDQIFDVMLKWGIKNDVQDEVHSETLQMDRHTLEIK